MLRQAPALFKSDSSEWKCHGMQEPPGHCDRVTIPSVWAGAPSLSRVSACSWAPPGTSENAPWRVAVRKVCGPSLSGGLGPKVLGALLVAVPCGHREETGRTGAFEEERMDSGSKGPCLNSEELLCSLLPSHRCSALPPGALCREPFSSVILFLSALTSLSL